MHTTIARALEWRALGTLLDDENARIRHGNRRWHRAKSFALETMEAQFERVLFS
jgi:hypothetical protein